MLHHLEHLIGRVETRPTTGPDPGPGQSAIAIRRAHDNDVPFLHDVAGLDSAAPLDGPVLVAVVDGRIWAAIGLDDERVIADPFLPTQAAIELLELRVRQLHAADGRPSRRMLPRWVARRARA